MTTQTLTISSLNCVSKHDFMNVVGDIVEHSPWVAERAFSARPFLSVDDLRIKLMACVAASTEDEKVALFNRHPELAGKEAAAGSMTEASTSEQSRLGLTSLSPIQFQRLAKLNRDYRAKFGFPFITAVRLHADLDSVVTHVEARLQHDRETEISETLRQISEIVYGRLCVIFPAG